MDVLISEVGPRDGLQSISAIMPTDAKKAWIEGAVAAGVAEIEVGSFVPPKLLPQLADTAEIVRIRDAVPGLTVAVLVPNARGAEDALAAGAHKITLPLSCSEIAQPRQPAPHPCAGDRGCAAIAAMIRALPADKPPAFRGQPLDRVRLHDRRRGAAGQGRRARRGS